LDYLATKSAVRVIGRLRADGGRRVPTVSFVVEGRMSESIVRHVDQFGIGIRFGDFYAKRLINSLGLDQYGGVVRASAAHYNTLGEVDQLIRHLDEVIG